MDKKAVVHIHNGVLLSHWKEYIWISSNEVDETGAYYTEWSKPERKTPIQYAAKSLQSCPTLCDPIDGSPPGSPIPGILQAKPLEWVAISFSNAWKWKVKSESEVVQSCLTLSDPMDCSLPGSSVHGIFQARVLEWGAIAFSGTERLHFHFSLSGIGEGNGTPLPCSCLENPREGKPGWLPSMGSQRVGHDWSDAAAAASIILNSEKLKAFPLRSGTAQGCAHTTHIQHSSRSASQSN